MLNKIIALSISNKLVVGFLVIILISFGSYQFTQLPIDAVPDITNNQVQVITSVPSLGATDIERLITFPVEQANSNIPGLKEIRSFSRFGLSVVTIVFDDDTDVYWARQQVSERLNVVKSQIPSGLGIPTLAPVTTGLGEIYQYVVRTKKGFEKKYDITELRTIQDWIVRRQLLGVQGVAEVSSFGGKLKQYEVAINTSKLNALNLTMADVFLALEKNNSNSGGSYIEKGPTVLYIRTEGLINSIAMIENIAIKNSENGRPIFVSDVANVGIGSAIRYGAMTYNGKGEVAGAVVMMLKGANSNVVIKNIKERIEQIQKTLPEGVVVEPFLDRTKMVSHSISTVVTNLIEGAIIVLLVLIFFLGNFRAGLIVASVIPLALLFAVILMNLFGVSGNLMSLGALDFGLIVDGSVIIVEACLYSLHSKKQIEISQKEMDATVLETAVRMRNVAVFGELIILIVYIPIFTLRGIEGKMFLPMAQTIAFALFGAFVLSLTYIPMMTSLFLSKSVTHKKNFSDRLMLKLENFYQPLLEKALAIPRIIIGATLSVFVLAVVVLSFLGGEFMPSLEEGDFAVETRVLTGSNLQTSIKAVSDGAKILLEKFPEVEKIVGKTGSSEVPTDPMPIDASDMMVILKDKSEWTSATTFDELQEKMAKELEAVPGVFYGFQYPVQMRFNELMTGARQDVVCKIFGENLDTLSVYANKLEKIAATVEGTSDLYVETVTGMPQIVVDYDRNMLAQYNLNIDQINKIVNTAFAGQSTGLVFEDEKRFDLVVRLDNQVRKDITDVENLLIPLVNGNQIPLSQLAAVKIVNGPNQIQREDAKRRIVVGFNVRGRDVQSIVQELQEKVATQIKFPVGYYSTYGGAFENLEQAKARLMVAVPVSLILIFILLYFAFRSIKLGLLIYSAIPLSMIGGIFFLAMRGMPFSISAGVGFIALFGVAVLNGLVLIAEFNRIRKTGETNLKIVVLQGTKIRLRPVLLTAFVASLGFLPMAISNGSGAEVQRPLATVVIGGLLVATFLTLFVLPILYVLVEKKSEKFMSKKIITIIVLIFSVFQTANAQSKITLEKAIEIALANNNQIKIEKLRIDYANALVNASADIPKANIFAEYGQINANVNDTRFGISQTFALPSVYKKQKQVLKEVYQSKILQTNLAEFELRKIVTTLFYDYLMLLEKQKLLKKSDSIYTKFVEKASLRFQKGESNILEKTTAEIQKTQIEVQLKQIESTIETRKLEFWLTINSAEKPFPEQKNIIIKSNFQSIENHPQTKIFEQNKKITLAETLLLKSRKLPEILVGYNNNSFIGIGLNDTRRFHVAQFGLGIPIFDGSLKAKIASAKIAENIAQLESETIQKKLKIHFDKLLLQYNAAFESYNLLSSQNLKNSAIITNLANKQFLSGEINYLDFVQIINQSISLQNSYLYAIENLNESIIELNFLNLKN